MFESKKAILAIAATLLVLLAAIYASSRVVLMSGFNELEERRVHAEVGRARDVLRAAVDELEAQAADWSIWDDSYDFARGRNPQYVKKNLSADMFKRLRVDFIAYTDQAGKIIYGAAYDPAAQASVSLPAPIINQLQGQPELSKPGASPGTAGFTMLGGAPAIIAVRPILTSEGRGPAAGMLIMARRLDEPEIERYAKQLHTRLNLRPLSAATRPSQAVQLRNDQEITGSVVLADVFGAPGMELRIVMARDIYHQGRKTARYFLLWLITIGVLFLVMICLMLRRLTHSEAQQREVEMRYQAVVQQSGEGIVLVERDSKRIFDSNAAFNALLGYRAEEIRVLGLKALLAEQHTADDMLHRLLHKGPGTTVDCRFRRKDRSLVDTEVTGNVVSYSGKEVICLGVRDLRERKRDQARIRYLAQFDELTNLPNRTLLRDHLQNAIDEARRDHRHVAVLILDLDRFKLVNESLGQHTGDALLQAATRRLKGGVRNTDLVARQGGDEFVIITTDLHDPEDCKSTAERVHAALATPFVIEDHELHVTTSIGVAVFPQDGEDVETLIKNADAAMYQAKKSGGNGFKRYATGMSEAGQERLTLEAALRRALEREEFSLVYQPQVDLATGAVFGAEALLRWQHPKLGNISPLKFIPLAEEIGLIVPIGEWVLRTACEQVREWGSAGLPAVRMGVNLSARQLSHPGLTKLVFATLQENGLDNERLDLEITESMLLSNMHENVRVLRELKESGVSISVDDFGTGYSSLSYLRELPINTVKIDRSFVQDIASLTSEAPLVKVILALAQNLKLEVLAEGVETADQAQFLRQHGCRAVQGFHFSKPVPPTEFARLLKIGRLPADQHQRNVA